MLNLDPLSREATASLLEAIAEGPVPDDLRTALLDRSGGNPFFLEELVSLLAETQVRGDDEHAVLPRDRAAGACRTRCAASSRRVSTVSPSTSGARSKTPPCSAGAAR